MIQNKNKIYSSANFTDLFMELTDDGKFGLEVETLLELFREDRSVAGF